MVKSPGPDDLLALRAEISDLRAALIACQERQLTPEAIAAGERRATRLQAALEQARRVAADQAGRIAELEAQLDAASATIAATRSSASWRAPRPLRALARLLLRSHRTDASSR